MTTVVAVVLALMVATAAVIGLLYVLVTIAAGITRDAGETWLPPDDHRRRWRAEISPDEEVWG